MTEDQLQAQCTQWFHNTYHHLRGTMFAIPNGGKRDKRTANLLKATGVRPGPADIFWLRPMVVIFIEMKLEDTGIQSKEQKEFQKTCQAYCHMYVILKTFEDFKKFVNDILTNTKEEF